MRDESFLDNYAQSKKFTRTRFVTTVDKDLLLQLQHYQLEHKDEFHTMSQLMDTMISGFFEKKSEEKPKDVLR
jgi:hypothetical protein